MMHARKNCFRSLALLALVLWCGYAQAAIPVYYEEPQEDLRVKVLGGAVVVKRTFANGQWNPNYDWANLQITYDPVSGSVSTIARGKALYTKTALGVFAYQKRDTITQTTTGFHWANRSGDFIDYNTQGQIQDYGDRNNVKVSFLYQTLGQSSVVAGLQDNAGNQVLWYEYTGNQLTGIHDYANRRVQYQYDGSGNLTKVIDANGNAWTYGYTNGVPTTFTDPENRTITRTWANNGEVASLRYADGTGTDYQYAYDSSTTLHYTQARTTAGKVTETWTDADGQVVRQALNGNTVATLATDTVARTRSTIDARGLTTIRNYDEWDNETKVTYPDGATVTTAYDPVFSQPTQKTDERGIITKYAYDANGNLTQMTEAMGLPEQRITTYTYDTNGQRLTRTQKGTTVTLPGNTTITIADATTTYQYDNYGNITSVTDAENNTTQYTYDVIGNALTKKDARGKIWTKTYDNRGMLTSDADPLGHATQYAHDKAGLRSKITDAANNVTTYAYDARGNVITITDPYGGTTKLEYNVDNQQTKQTDQSGIIQTTSYDVDGRLSKVTDGDGNVIQYVYGDPQTALANLLVKVIYPTYTEQYQYDARGNVTTVTDILNATTNFSSKTSYDAAGNRISTTDQGNQTTNYAYDALGRRKTITDPVQGVTQYTYDNRDNLIALTDPNNHTHRFAYDRRNLKTQEIRPLGQTITYTYDGVGNLAQMTDPKGQVRKYAYDDAGRRVGESDYLTATDTTAAKTVTYTYNNLNELTGYNDGTTQGATNYDTRQLRKTGETVNYGSFSLSYSYNYYANGLKKSFTGPDGVTVNYTYDKNNQLITIALPSGSVAVNQYNWTAPAQITLPGGTTRTQIYDPLLRLTGISVKDPLQNPVMSHQITYNPTDNITQRTTESGTYSYTYDNLYRLTAATNPSPLVAEGYTYDAVGNRLTDSNVTGSVTYNANNQFTQAGSVSYSYDANGNTTQKIRGTITTVYTYDTSDRLTEVDQTDTSTSTTTTIAKYTYDPFGRRLWKEINNARTYFFYSDEGLIAEADNTDTLTTVYGYKPNSTWGTDPVYLKQGTNYYFYQNDHLGTSQKLIAQDGTVVWSAKAQAFGQTVVDASSTVTNNLRFPGQYYDAETGNHYNWNRYYDPKSGRYLTSDPIGLDGGLNAYVYANDNSLSDIDPSGLIKWRGTSLDISFAEYVGFGYSYFDLKTDCINGKRGFVRAIGYGPAAGVGAKLRKLRLPKAHPEGTASGIEFEDNNIDVVDPSAFGGGWGSFQSAGASVVVGTGFSHSITRCGHAFARDTSKPGEVIGLDVGALGVYGTCTVLSSRVENCCGK